MSQRIATADWLPHNEKGELQIEPAASAAIRAYQSELIVAGPGAGKTELLAQRACYLLQTGEIGPHSRILALSRKRDASKNLKDRVARRCGKDLAHRFESYTLDGWAKSLLDRFRLGLPEACQPTANYVIDDKVSMPANGLAAWQEALGRHNPSRLSFSMITRLATGLLQKNPQLVKALRTAYGTVFLDEFQDTSAEQFALLKIAFSGSQIIVTAVGDPKQRIMGFAQADNEVFKKFQASPFNASRRELLVNYRSAPRLVEIQTGLINGLSLQQGSAVSQAAGINAAMIGECRILSFVAAQNEAEYLTDLITQWRLDGIPPSEICLITRQRSNDYTSLLQTSLTAKGISSRVQDKRQDLLTEPVVQTILNAFRVMMTDRAPTHWQDLVEQYLWLCGIDDLEESEAKAQKAADKLAAFLKTLAPDLQIATSLETIQQAATKFISFIDEAAFCRVFPQYLQLSFLHKTIKDCAQTLAGARQHQANPDWKAALDDVEGLNAIPIMTIHKSKGLEFHTVVFVGLEDNAFLMWDGKSRSFSDAASQEFFVAFSRAKQRVLFTFSNHRLNSPQNQLKLDSLYHQLLTAGVQVETIS